MSTSRVGRGLDGCGGGKVFSGRAVWPFTVHRNSTASANPACTGQHRFGPGETLQREGDPLALPPSGRLQPVAGYLEPDRGNTSTHATTGALGRAHGSPVAGVQSTAVAAAFALPSRPAAGAFGMLTKWWSFTRLETRTKESNTCASIWVANPDAQ